MLVQPHARSFRVRCYSCKREVEIHTRTWEFDPKRRILDYWGACPYCGTEIFEYTSPLAARISFTRRLHLGIERHASMNRRADLQSSLD